MRRWHKGERRGRRRGVPARGGGRRKQSHADKGRGERRFVWLPASPHPGIQPTEANGEAPRPVPSGARRGAALPHEGTGPPQAALPARPASGSPSSPRAGSSAHLTPPGPQRQFLRAGSSPSGAPRAPPLIPRGEAGKWGGTGPLRACAHFAFYFLMFLMPTWKAHLATFRALSDVRP